MTAIILTHLAASDTTIRHIPIWLKFFDSLIFICPEDAPFYNSVGTTHLSGLSCHSGFEACKRMRYACEIAAEHNECIIIEYDTLIFKQPEIIKNKILGSALFVNEMPTFMSKWWIHSPWLTTQDNWKKLSKTSIDIEATYTDRWLAAACDYNEILPGSLPYSYSTNYFKNTIENWWEIEAATGAVMSGAVAIHGVKTQQVFDILTNKINSCTNL
jgi:hypothetical protein